MCPPGAFASVILAQLAKIVSTCLDGGLQQIIAQRPVRIYARDYISE